MSLPRDLAPLGLAIQDQWILFMRAVFGDLLRVAGYPPAEIDAFLQRTWPLGEFDDGS